MSPQGISSMLSMRIIEKHRGTYPPQYRLTQSTEEEAYEDIPNDVPPQHEDPPTQPLPPSRPVHVAASYAAISEHLTRFQQQTYEPLPPPEYPPLLSYRLLSKTPETRSKNTPEPCSNNDKGPIYEERRLQIEELDEWRTHKPKTHDNPKPHHDKLNISPNQLKVGDKVLLNVANPWIATSEPNGAIPLMILSIFPYEGMRSVNSSHHHDHAPERAKFFLSTGCDKWP
ncbi:hypothetical protein GOBAR_AA16325 [Gossypium barbadense]|uniref:Uncharacterized protein n=1 Tax=Gossypium barbadense TaxID=3634 RepID=A0A2P5XLX3_GOSBA|nr:hypothetical protein GOBAR_AA16325 [Gossypium barbadense]